MKRILVFGAGGLLGEACVRILSQHSEVKGLTREDVDLTDGGALAQLLDGEEFDVVINAAAISGLEQCLEQPDSAHKVNVRAPELMAEICAEKNAQFVHFSTDYVFGGKEDQRPSEESETHPVNVYGKTKLAGEQAALAANPNSLVCRVSWLFGRGRKSFVDQVLSTALTGDEGTYISDKVSVPNFCDDLVNALHGLLEKNATGVLHLSCPSEPESWHSYALKVVKTAQKLGLLNKIEPRINASFLKDAHFFKEQRPKFTAMASERIAEEFGIELPDWQVGLENFLRLYQENRLT